MNVAMRERTGHLSVADLGLGILGASLVTCAIAFAVWGIPPLPPAPLVLLGIPSPLTGMTRSFVALARGDLAVAFGWHPLGPICFLAAILAAAKLAWSVAGRSVALPSMRGWGWYVAAAFGAVWVRQIVVYG